MGLVDDIGVLLLSHVAAGAGHDAGRFEIIACYVGRGVPENRAVDRVRVRLQRGRRARGAAPGCKRKAGISAGCVGPVLEEHGINLRVQKEHDHHPEAALCTTRPGYQDTREGDGREPGAFTRGDGTREGRSRGHGNQLGGRIHDHRARGAGAARVGIYFRGDDHPGGELFGG